MAEKKFVEKQQMEMKGLLKRVRCRRFRTLCGVYMVKEAPRSVSDTIWALHQQVQLCAVETPGP